jgi:pSer/pThr/pTyr-binding forkhead associated (FHA) protein
MELALEWSASRLILDNRRVGIGRLPNNQITLEDVQVSGLHAEIIPTACGVLLIDLGSRNGTFVNEHRLMPDVPHVLQSSDKIRVGQTILRFWVRVGQM